MTQTVIRPVILSGGSGTRLWPLSREQYPKQLLPLVGDDSLLQDTISRLDGIAGDVPPLVVCNEQHRFIVAEQMRLKGVRGAILLEPTGRNTAPALTLAALEALHAGEDPVLVAMPADHVVADVGAFGTAVREAARLAQSGRLVMLGIQPDCPETGYGYIRLGEPIGDGAAFALSGFEEKPDAETAQRYLDASDYLWNSGIFVMRASVWNAALKVCRPDIFEACQRAWEGRRTDGDFVRVNAEAFTACPADSVDYSVMERLSPERPDLPPGAVVPLSAGWSDVGAWDALWKVLPKDTAGNAWRGDVLLHDTQNTLAISSGRLLACVGVSDLVVVETSDAILVAHHDSTQEVKHIVSALKVHGRDETASHRKVFRPWGWYDAIDNGERFQVKRIMVKPGAALSLQMHHHRAEHWIVVRGTARVTRGDAVFLVTENQSTYIPLGERHRLENPGTLPLEMIEVQSGAYLGEDDIVRFEDSYGRLAVVRAC